MKPRRPIPISGRASRSLRPSSMSQATPSASASSRRSSMPSPPCIERAGLASPEGTPADIWARGFAETYRTELRPEASGRAREIVTANADFYDRMADLSRQAGNIAGFVAATAMGWKGSVGGPAYQGGIHIRRRRLLCRLEDRAPQRPEDHALAMAAAPSRPRRPSAVAAAPVAWRNKIAVRVRIAV